MIKKEERGLEHPSPTSKCKTLGSDFIQQYENEKVLKDDAIKEAVDAFCEHIDNLLRRQELHWSQAGKNEVSESLKYARDFLAWNKHELIKEVKLHVEQEVLLKLSESEKFLEMINR